MFSFLNNLHSRKHAYLAEHAEKVGPFNTLSLPKQQENKKQNKLFPSKKLKSDREYCKIQWWRETHCKTKKGGCEWRVEQCRRTLASLRWHTSVPSCRIYPGALGLCSEKTQMARGVLQLAAVRVPLSGPLERGKDWMNGGKTRGIRRGGGGGQRESSKWFQGAGPTCRKRWVSRRMLLCTEEA